MKILLFGTVGQLGWELQRSLACLGEVIALDYPQVDFSKPHSLREVVRSAAADVVINAVAYTNVDKAESEPELCHLINAEAVGVLAEEALRAKAALIHYSTDYVFDGRKGSPYVETDEPNPLGVYAASKLAGEQVVVRTEGSFVVLRSSWIYSNWRDNFVKKVLSWAHSKSELSIVDDQIGCPTWARCLAEITALMLSKGGKNINGWVKERSGIYHLANTGYTSRYDWALEILKRDPQKGDQLLKTITRAKTSDFPTNAQRPLFSALDCTYYFETFDLTMPNWQKALALALPEITPFLKSEKGVEKKDLHR